MLSVDATVLRLVKVLVFFRFCARFCDRNLRGGDSGRRSPSDFEADKAGLVKFSGFLVIWKLSLTGLLNLQRIYALLL